MKKVKIVIILLLFATIFITIGYSSMSETLSITGEAAFQVYNDVRIINFKKISGQNAISENEAFEERKIYSNVILNNSNSEITYAIDVINYTNYEVGLLKIDGLPSNLKYSISDENNEFEMAKDPICTDGKCTNGVIKTLYLTIKYQDNEYDSNNTSFDLKLQPDFEMFNTITYIKIDNTNLPNQIINNGNLKIKLNNVLEKNLSITAGGTTLVKGTDYTYDSNGNLNIFRASGNLIIKNIETETSGLFPNDTIEFNGLTLTSYGDGTFELNGTTASADKYYLRLNDVLYASQDRDSTLTVAPNIKLASVGDYVDFNYNIISGTNNVSESGEFKAVFRSPASGDALTTIGYDAITGYYGVRNGILESDIGMYSLFIDSTKKMLTFDHYKFEIELNVIASEVNTYSVNGLTFNIYNDGMISISGTASTELYIRLAPNDFLASSNRKDLVSNAYTNSPIFKAGDTVKIKYDYVSGAPTNANEIVFVLRGNDKNSTNLNSTKLSTKKGSANLLIPSESTEAIVVPSKDASFGSMYISQGLTFNNYCFYVNFSKVN